MIKIQRATKKDLPEIIELSMDLLPYHVQFSRYYVPIKDKAKWNKISAKYFRKLMKSRNARFWVAEDEGKIVGYGIGQIKKPPPVLKLKYYGQVEEVYIAKKYRGKGIAGKFIKEILDWFKKRNIKRVLVNFDARNKMAKRVYNKAGFKPFQENYELWLK